MSQKKSLCQRLKHFAGARRRHYIQIGANWSNSKIHILNDFVLTKTENTQVAWTTGVQSQLFQQNAHNLFSLHVCKGLKTFPDRYCQLISMLDLWGMHMKIFVWPWGTVSGLLYKYQNKNFHWIKSSIRNVRIFLYFFYV